MNFGYKIFSMCYFYIEENKFLQQNHFHHFIRMILAFEIDHSFSRNGKK